MNVFTRNHTCMTICMILENFLSIAKRRVWMMTRMKISGNGRNQCSIYLGRRQIWSWIKYYSAVQSFLEKQISFVIFSKSKIFFSCSYCSLDAHSHLAIEFFFQSLLPFPFYASHIGFHQNTTRSYLFLFFFARK